MTEAEIQRQCIELLTRTGWLVVRVNSGRTRNIPWARWYNSEGLCRPKGVSDLLCIKDGRFLAIEVKAPGETISPFQREFLQAAENHGAEVLIIDDVKDLESYL
jgi:Holliday junction resolvase